MAALILDASVVIALLDTADSHHERAVDDVEGADREDRELLRPASAYSETLVDFARAKRAGDARDAIAAMGISVAALTATIAETAAELRAEHRTACACRMRSCWRPRAGSARGCSATTSVLHGPPLTAESHSRFTLACGGWSIHPHGGWRQGRASSRLGAG